MKKGIPALRPQEEGDFQELMTANKCLALEKRELHRQKLRVYSQKAVKLRAILRETADPDQKKCLQSKLQLLQQKQDGEITKLAKIDQIEKEIDGFMTEENEDNSNHSTLKDNASRSSQSSSKSIHQTPAQRLRTKTSANYKAYQDHPQSTFTANFSRNKVHVSNKKQVEEILLNDSRQVLEEVNNNRINRSLTQTHSKPSLKSKHQQHSEQCYLEDEGSIEYPRITDPPRKPSDTEECQQLSEDLEGVPEVLKCLVQKVSKFWPLQILSLIKYLKSAEETRLSYVKREQKLRRDQQRVRRCEQRSKNIDDKVLQLIQKQRFLMEAIDRLEKEEQLAQQQIQTSLRSLANAAEVISKSSIIPETEDPIKVSYLMPESLHKFSVESFQSFREASSLAGELVKFEKALQSYLLSAERAVMMVNAQYQKISSRVTKYQQEVPALESLKKTLEEEVGRVESWLKIKQSSLKEMEEEVRILKEQMAEYSGTVDLKKALVAELEEKGEKLKIKKKSASERLKRMEDDVESLTLKKEELFELVLNLEQKVVGLKTYEKQLETKIIFCERDKVNREQDLKLLEQKGEEIIKRISESNQVNDQAINQITLQKSELSRLTEKILQKTNEEQQLNQRIQALNKEIEASNCSLLDLQNQNQKENQEIVGKKAEVTQLVESITEYENKLKEMEHQFQEGTARLIFQQQLLEKEKQQISDTEAAKEELEGLLHEVILKKEQIIAELEEKSKELTLLIGDLQNGHEDYQHLAKKVAELQTQIGQKYTTIKELQTEQSEVREDLEEQLKEEENIIARLSKLKEAEKVMLLGIAIKGGSSYLDEELKVRVNETIQELNSLNDLKSQLKECKYENRKVKLENQRLAKLVQEE